MLKQCLTVLAGLSLWGCTNQPSHDWAMDCERNSSETGREFAACMEAKATQSTANADKGASVTTTPEGSKVPYLEGKTQSAEHDEADGGA